MDSSNNAIIHVLINNFPQINLLGLLIEDVVYVYAYLKTKSIFIRFNSGSCKYTVFNSCTTKTVDKINILQFNPIHAILITVDSVANSDYLLSCSFPSTMRAFLK